MKTKAISKNSKGIKKDACGSSTASSVQAKKGSKKVDKNKIVKTISVWSNQKDYFQMDRCYDNW